MKTFKYIYITVIFAVLAIMGCGRGTGEQGLTHEDVVAINERVLEKAIGQPDSALMMIEGLRAGDYSLIDTTGASLQWNGPLPDYRCDYLRAKVYGQSLRKVWNEWKIDEKKHQEENLAIVREYPITETKKLTKEPLGSVSPFVYNPNTGKAYAAMNAPGDFAHLTEIDLNTGK